MRKLSVLLLALGCSALAQAARAPVVDLSGQAPPTANSQPAMRQPQQLPQQNQGPDFYSQIQLLQEEVRQLRGIVEEQANEIQQLKQRQMDDYMDLDRRLSGGGPSTAGAGRDAGENPMAPAGTPAPSTVEASAAESEHYNTAYNLLKDRKIDEAVPAFKEHIARYPRGKYVANAYYWLGEIYMLQNKLEDARQAFARVVEDYPAHRKAADATFKLGKAYHLLGNDAKARQYLEQVAAGNSSAARLAQSYLRDNF